MRLRSSVPIATACCTLLACWALGGGTGEKPFQPDRYKPLFQEAAHEGPWVQGRSHDLAQWPYLDGQWQGITSASDGNVYFSVSSHSPGHHADVFRYLPDEGRIEHLANLGDVCPTPADGAPQDKIHTEMIEADDWILAATCDGPLYDGLTYYGGHWIGIHQPSGLVKDLGRTKSGDGIIALGYDPERRVLYGHTNRKGRLLQFCLETGEETDLGVPWQGSGAQFPRGVALMVAPDGKVYGGRPPACSFWQWDPDSQEFSTIDPDLPVPEAVAAGDPGANGDYQKSAIHLARWNEQDECFYFVRSFDEMLGRFFPGEGDTPPRAELVHRLRPKDLPYLYDNRLAATVLVIHDRTVYYTPYTGWGGQAHLVSYHLDNRTWQSHGPVILEEGRRVAEIHALTAGPDGKLYGVAFTYSREGEDPVQPYALRDGYPFHPRFFIIDPTTLASQDPQ